MKQSVPAAVESARVFQCAPGNNAFYQNLYPSCEKMRTPAPVSIGRSMDFDVSLDSMMLTRYFAGGCVVGRFLIFKPVEPLTRLQRIAVFLPAD